MKCVILAGGEGTRISEETRYIPKPMIQVGGVPLLRHIMNIYMKHGIHEFIIPVGYKAEIILGYFMSQENISWSTENGFSHFITSEFDVTIIPTGRNTQTGGRIGRLREILTDDFCMTYGDGVSDVDINRAIKLHKNKNRAIVTITAVRPAPRFGAIDFMDKDSFLINKFGEKTENLKGWINGGFAVLSPKIFNLIDSDDCNLEKDVYPQLAYHGMLYGVRHEGFWHCVDTLRDLQDLEHIVSTQGEVWI